MKRGEWRFEPRILILFLILGIVPPVVGHLILVSGAREVYLEQIGVHLSQRATDVQRELENLIENAILQVTNLAHNQKVLDSLAANGGSAGQGNQLSESIQRTEQSWAGLAESDAPLKEILDNPVSELLREQGKIVPTFREILVTDRLGRLVAATNKTSDYYQADESWWQRAALQGQGARYVGDVAFDESANTYGMEIAEPIRDARTGTVVGVIKAILDSPALFARLEAANAGISEEETLLVRTDGTMIWSPDARTRNDFAAEMKEAIGLSRSFLTASDRDGKLSLIGLPSSGLGDRIPELDWYVIVGSSYTHILVPFENLNRRFLYIVLATILVVVGLALVFTHIVSRPAVDVDPHFERLGSPSR